MKLTGIEKKLGNFSICIEKFSISVPGIYGLVGPNGSGKSTLAKLMAGLLEPDRGSIDHEGLNSKEITLLQRKPYLLNDSVYNNLVYPLKLRNIKPDLALVDFYLEKMGLSERRKQKARSLSSGEQQKLAFLRALIFKPRFIIADEAMTAMDIDSLDLFENMIIESVEKDNCIWVIISHQMPHIRRLAGFLFFLYGGKIEAEGTAETILAMPSNQHLRQYLRVYGGGEETK
jgi:ABC-type multidrug transport system ATPase subunit